MNSAIDSTCMYKNCLEWTNEEKDWIEDYGLNPEAEVHRQLFHLGIPVSLNHKFYKSKKNIWYLLGISDEGYYEIRI